MCGISGIYTLNNAPLSLDTLKCFTDSMVHRGPDGAGYELFDNDTLGLGQRRLSILDLSEAGKQPMSYADGRYWISFNGEIYNFIEVRVELQQLGYSFQSDTDTEVILAAYIQWGKECLDKFNGMWAFAIWDEQEKNLFLARDRFGIKPLYYVHLPNNFFAFASETRAFKFLNGYKREFNEELLKLNLDDSYALEGLGYTPFKDIVQLLPGHFMNIKKHEIPKQTRWWHIEDHLHKEIPQTIKDQAEKFYELFRDACRMRLVSDVPIGTALSGGLDSSAVYSTIYDILAKEKLVRINKDSQRAFTAIFPGLPNDEHTYALAASKYSGGRIESIETQYEDLANQIVKDTELADFISTSPITSIASVYKGMKQSGISVSMDGHGVDEMLYGYRDMVYGLYNNALWKGTDDEVNAYSKVLQSMYHPDVQEIQEEKFSKALNEKIKREKSFFYQLKRKVIPQKESDSYSPISLPSLSNRPYNFANKTLPERMVYHEFFEHCLPALLRNFDRASMMNSIEIRMPFMDWRIVTYVFSLPINSKIGEGYTKLILREAMKGKMDESIRSRTFKVGISSPVEFWFNGSLKEWVLDSIKDNQQKKELNEAYQNQGLNNHQVTDTWLGMNVDLIR